MFSSLTLILIGYIQDKLEDSTEPWHWAIFFSVITFAFSIFQSGSLLLSLITTLILGLYSLGYFILVRKFSDSIFLWLLCLIGGAFLLPFLSFF